MARESVRYSKVDRRAWRDAKFRALSAPGPSARYLWLYLLTGPHNGSIPGVFVLSYAAAGAELGWSTSQTRTKFGEVEAAGMAKVDRETWLVWLPKALEHNRPESPNVVVGWRTLWAELPECQLKNEVATTLREQLALLGRAYSEAFDVATGRLPPRPSSNSRGWPSSDRSPKASVNPQPKASPSPSLGEAPKASPKPCADPSAEASPEPSPKGSPIQEQEQDNPLSLVFSLPPSSAVPETHTPEGRVLNLMDAMDQLARRSQGKLRTSGDSRIEAEVAHLLADLAERLWSLADFAVLGDYVGAGGLDWHDIAKPDLRYLVRPGVLAGLLAEARDWAGEGRPPVRQKARKGERARPSTTGGTEGSDPYAPPPPILAEGLSQ